MNTFIKAFGLLALITFFNTACSTHNVQAQSGEQPVSKSVTYQRLLGKSLNDQDVTEFITSNPCSPAAEFQLCKEAGMAFWIDTNQVVKTIYLYSGNSDGFRRYRGDLPFGLTFYDPMWRVQEKLMDPNSANFLSQTGFPDEAVSPDHMHYWAMYKRLGITVIYDSPGNDEDAYIHAILVSE